MDSQATLDAARLAPQIIVVKMNTGGWRIARQQFADQPNHYGGDVVVLTYLLLPGLSYRTHAQAIEDAELTLMHYPEHRTVPLVLSRKIDK